MVPITSDLSGYTAFWTRVVLILGLVFFGAQAAIVWLLVLIWRKLPPL